MPRIKKDREKRIPLPNTTEHRSWNMSRVGQKDTKPEMLVRRLVYGMGYRYRLHGKDLPGKPDLVFRQKRKVIFVHGCFWHAHDDERCKRGRAPKSRLDYWEPKLARNSERDQKNQDALQRQGWQVMVIWECELKEFDLVAARLRSFLSEMTL